MFCWNPALKKNLRTAYLHSNSFKNEACALLYAEPLVMKKQQQLKRHLCESLGEAKHTVQKIEVLIIVPYESQEALVEHLLTLRNQ